MTAAETVVTIVGAILIVIGGAVVIDAIVWTLRRLRKRRGR